MLAVAKLDVATVGRSLAAANFASVLLAVGLMASSFIARAESWFAALNAALPDAPIGRALTRRGLLIGMATSTVAPCSPGRGGPGLGNRAEDRRSA